MTVPDPDLPLLGRTVGVTAARRFEEQITILERRGATVLHAPATRVVPLAEDPLVRAATERAITAPADIMVLTTGVGVRWWVEACREWGLADQLVELMAGIPVYSRGPKSTGAVRGLGLREYASAASETSPELLEMLLERGVAGLTVCVQLQGPGDDQRNPMAPMLDGLRRAGADVIEVPVYRWELPRDLEPLDHLVRAIARAEVDGVTFTAQPAVLAVLERARALGEYDAVLAAFNGPVAALCVGPVCAAPLVELDVAHTCSDRMRLGSLMRHTTDELANRPARS